MGCYPRKIAVLQQLKDFDKWKDSVSYEYRYGWQKKLCSHQSRECLENMCVCQKIPKHDQGINTKSVAVQHVYYHENLDRKVSSYEERNIYATQLYIE